MPRLKTEESNESKIFIIKHGVACMEKSDGIFSTALSQSYNN